MSKEKLTPKQQKFCEEYMVDLNATQAAKRAGYSEKTANQLGPRLLVNVGIQAEIVRLKQKISEETFVTIKYVVEGLKEVADRCMQKKPVMVFNKKEKHIEQVIDVDGQGVWTFDSSGANRSLELLGKHLGAFKEYHEHTGKNGKPIEHKVDHTIDKDTAETIFDILEKAGAISTSTNDAKDDKVHTTQADT